MQDRVPTYPGRVTLTPVPGQTNKYDMVRADEPTQEGTPLNKATLLSDGVCAALGVPTTSVPDDALAKLAVGAGKYGYFLTVKFSDGTPASGITVTGVTKADGTDCITDNNGNVLGMSTSASPTISITECIDIAAYSATLTSTGIITPVAITLTDASPNATITTSQSIKFSRDVLVDVHAVGGGYNGVAATNTSNAAGGADGRQHFRLNVPISKNVSNTAQIGAVGGGNTSFAGVYSSSGSNNAGGAYRENGISATVRLFGTGSVVAGGSGGGGHFIPNTTSGGSPFGGGGGQNAMDARGYGGGGGGAYVADFGGTAGKGYQGVLFLQWRYAA